MEQQDGLLPYFLLLTSALATIHSAICYLSPAASLKPFSGPRHPPHTPLLAHVYGIKNILMAAIRAYAAYDINSKGLYDLAMMTYAGVLWLFLSEMVGWGTVRMRDIGLPFATTVLGLGWMVGQRAWYVGV